MQRSLSLFIILLCTLTISVYFGNMSFNFSENMVDKDKDKKKGKDDDKETDDDKENDKENVKVDPTVAANIAPTDGKINISFSPSDLTSLFASLNALDMQQQTEMNNSLQFGGRDVGGVGGVGGAKNPVSDYYNWLAFWNTVATSTDKNNALQTSNYIPKTQAVPKVAHNCPKCQSGSNGGVCVGCGGLGGGGATLKYKNRFSDFMASHGAGYVRKGSGSGGEDGVGLGKLAEKTGSGVVDLTKTALNNATGLASGAGSGAAGLLRDTGSGAVDLLKDTGSGAVDLLKDTGSGAIGLLKETGAGAAGLLKSNPTILNQQNQSGQMGQSGQSAGIAQNSPGAGTYTLPNNPMGLQGIDPYSYNGALVAKGSNFIPVTNDFSAFRK